MKKVIALVAAATVIATTSSAFAESSVTEKYIPFPLSVSNNIEKETPYWLYQRIENTAANSAKMDSGFKLIMGHMYPTKECQTEGRYWRETKPGCNKVDIDWGYIGNPKTGEISDTRIILLDVDLGKEMTWDEQWDYINKIGDDKSAILGKAYIMTVNPKYYETKGLSEDKSVFILPIKDGMEPKDLALAFNDGTNYKYYKDSNGQYFRSFGVGDTVYYWQKVFKNDSYDKGIENLMQKCSNLECSDAVFSKYAETVSGKILSHEVETNPDEETKEVIKAVSGLFDE